MTIDPLQPAPAPEPSPSTAPPAEAIPTTPPPFALMPPSLPEPVPPRQPWRFWATLGWGLLVLLGWFLVQAIVTIVIMVGSGMFSNHFDLSSEEQMQAFKIRMMSLSFCPATIISCPVGLALIWLFIRIRRLPVLEYLGLRRVRVKPLLISLGAMLAVVLGMDFLANMARLDTGDEVMTQILLQAPSKFPVWVALVMAAPLFEELCFRGFLFRGFSLAIGPILTILLTSASFAALHTQYNIFGMLMVFTAGLTLGCTRWLTGSTTITILQHALMNGMAFVQAYYFQN